MYLFLAAIGIIFLFLEFRKSNIFNLTFACSFIFTAIFWYKYTSNFMYIFVFFCLSSFIFYCLIKGILIREKSEIEKRKNISNLIGKKAIVKKDIKFVSRMKIAHTLGSEIREHGYFVEQANKLDQNGRKRKE